MSSNTTKTVAFLGASTGVGLSALKHTLAAGHQCIALCRSPSKLSAHFPSATAPSNLQIIEGNAHDTAAVTKCLQTKDGKLVEAVVFTIGSKMNMSKFAFEDPEVCQKGMATLLEALEQLRRQQGSSAAGNSAVSDGAVGHGSASNPHIIVCSTTGISRFGRDTPLVIVPIYGLMGKVPHRDKIAMEDRLVASGEAFTIVHASLLVDGESSKPIRVGIEDPKTGRESDAIGYTISREDAGRWMAENLVLKSDAAYANKIAMITY